MPLFIIIQVCRLWCPCVRRLSQDLTADTGLLCDKAAVLGDTKKGHFLNANVKELKARLLRSVASDSLFVSGFEGYQFIKFKYFVISLIHIFNYFT
jgi:hypothetical protein